MNDEYIGFVPAVPEPEGFPIPRSDDPDATGDARTILEENLLLRQICAGNTESGTVVYTKDRKVFYSTLSKEDAPLAGFLEAHLKDFETHDRFKLTRQYEGFRYRISARRILSLGMPYYVYYISRRLPDAPGGRQGIHYFSEEDLRKEISNVIFPVPGVEGYNSEEIQQGLSSYTPVLIFGESGVGKRHLALLIYLTGPFVRSPFVVVDFSEMNRQSWTFLMGKGDSPLWDTDVTLFFKNIEMLDSDRLSQFLSVLKVSGTGLRNRIIISCTVDEECFSSASLQSTVRRLPCLTIHMGELKGQYSVIKRTIYDLLNRFHGSGDPVDEAFTPEALSMLLHYSWPQNYRQLYRVVDKLLVLCEGKTITEDMVREALTTETLLTQKQAEKTQNSVLDLTKSLEEINSAIVQLILEQNGGNQALAAKSLGISRTTMWRMMKAYNQKEEEAKAAASGDVPQKNPLK